MSETIAGVRLPDSAMAQAATRLIRDTHPELLFLHALRAFLFGALIGVRNGVTFDADLLYVGALFHNAGLDRKFDRSVHRFEVDSANEARAFLRQFGIGKIETDLVWCAIALHTTPGIAWQMAPLIALVHAGVQMDLQGLHFDELSERERDEIIAACPREMRFKQQIIEAYAQGMQHRPETTYGTLNADVLDRWDPGFQRINFCGRVLGSRWPH